MFGAYRRKKCSALIMAAGNSVRMGENKLLMELGGTPVLVRTLGVFEKCRAVDEIIIVTRTEDIPVISRFVKKYRLSKVTGVTGGGEERVNSVFMGLKKISKKTGLVAIHDGARPFVTEEIIEETVRAASKFNAAAPAVPITSTVKRTKNGVIAETLDREELVLIQTPQVFEASLIKGAVEKAITDGACVTDDCMAAERIGVTVHLTAGSQENIKLTAREDIVIAEAIMKARGEI